MTTFEPTEFNGLHPDEADTIARLAAIQRGEQARFTAHDADAALALLLDAMEIAAWHYPSWRDAFDWAHEIVEGD